MDIFTYGIDELAVIDFGNDEMIIVRQPTNQHSDRMKPMQVERV